MKPRYVILTLTAVIGAGLALTMLSPAQKSMLGGAVSTLRPTALTPNFSTRETSEWAAPVIAASRAQIGVTTRYDGAYVALAYPMGDVDRRTGVCTDVVIRALRDAHGVDLQQSVHEDMRRAFSAYPTIWGLSHPDRNIDHRRVPNLRRYFEREGRALPISEDTKDYLPGDLVTWTLGPGKPHIGIVSDRADTKTGEPLILHNVGAGTREQRFLFAYPITGHYRLSPP